MQSTGMPVFDKVLKRGSSCTRSVCLAVKNAFRRDQRQLNLQSQLPAAKNCWGCEVDHNRSHACLKFTISVIRLSRFPSWIRTWTGFGPKYYPGKPDATGVKDRHRTTIASNLVAVKSRSDAHEIRGVRWAFCTFNLSKETINHFHWLPK